MHYSIQGLLGWTQVNSIQREALDRHLEDRRFYECDVLCTMQAYMYAFMIFLAKEGNDITSICNLYQMRGRQESRLPPCGCENLWLYLLCLLYGWNRGQQTFGKVGKFYCAEQWREWLYIVCLLVWVCKGCLLYKGLIWSITQHSIGILHAFLQLLTSYW